MDAGGQGWLLVLEGALYYLNNGTVIEKNEVEEEKEEQHTSAQQKIETDDIKFMYCTEFIVEKKNSSVNVLSFKKAIETIGDSMLVIDDDEIVKVHIHTNNPGIVLENAVKMGAMINIKIDNMKHQHQSIISSEEPKREEMPKKPYGFVSVCAGDGISGIFKDLGIDVVIEGGQTMNPSTDDILDASENINADTIFVFPNNKNIILAANQAQEISEKKIIVIPTRSIPECISAMLVFNGDKSPEDNEKAMNKAVSKVKTGQVTYAVRDTEIEDKKIEKDDILGLSGSKITTVGKEPEQVLIELVEQISDEDTEFITLYYGEDVTEETEVAASAVEDTPGEAVLANSNAIASIADLKLTREQARSKNKETLNDIVNNETLSDEQKQNAVNKMVELTDVSEKEAAAEILLQAKGFTDVVVNIENDTVDVIVNVSELTDANRAQIEDIVKRKTGISGENIVITTLNSAK